MRALSTMIAVLMSVVACAATVSLTPTAWCFDTSWNMVRVVSAGPDDAEGLVRVEIAPDGTVFIMR